MAIQFNLLPWREELRAKRLKRNQSSLGVAAVLGLLAGAGYYGYEKIRLSDHEKAKQLIERKNKEIQPKLKEKKRLDALKEDLNNQIDAIEALQADRASVSHMVEELSTANDQQLFLTNFSLENGAVNISGIAENDAEIADLMKKLRRSEWYQEPQLGTILSSKDHGGEIKEFKITSQLLLPGSKQSQPKESK